MKVNGVDPLCNSMCGVCGVVWCGVVWCGVCVCVCTCMCTYIHMFHLVKQHRRHVLYTLLAAASHSVLSAD